MLSADLEKIYGLIPHRPPFLWVDRIVESGDGVIRAEKIIPPDLELFRGHYPGHPVVPGVLLCEAVFQAGALMIANQLAKDGEKIAGLPVLTRITGARFKREVRPGDTIGIEARLREQVGDA